MTDSRRFIIVCPARSGSTMLVHLLRSHPDCVSNSEVLALTDKIGGFDPTVRPYLDTLGSESDLIRWRKRDPVDFMNRAGFYAGDHLWGGFKIKSDELVLRKYSALLAGLRADTSIKVLHLNRSNLLHRYISWVMVNKVTGVTMAVREEDKPEFEPVEINPKKAERDFVLAEERQGLLDAWFADHDVLQLDYDALTRDIAGESARICAFLDIESRTLTTRTIKIAPHVSNLVTNFEELQSYFAGSRFEPLFQAPEETSPAANAPEVVAPSSEPPSYRIPGAIRSPRDEWGRTGTPLHAYLAALCDRPDLSKTHVLAVGNHTDMLESLARGEAVVGGYLGLEGSDKMVDYVAEHPASRAAQLVPFDVNSVGPDSQWILASKYDVVFVQRPPDTTSGFAHLTAGLRRTVSSGARMVVAVAEGDDAEPIATLEANGWRVDERRPARRSLGPHLVCTAVARPGST